MHPGRIRGTGRPKLTDIKLHIGCGADVFPGWVNIDRSPSVLLHRAPRLRRALLALRILTPQQAAGLPAGIVRADVSKHIPAATASVAFIYCAHMIEHLARWQGLAFLRECRRVLAPGGVLRLATPDLELMVADYVQGTSPFAGATRGDAFCSEYGAYSDPDANLARKLSKKILGGDTHQWVYDTESITRLLHEGGFTHVDRKSFREGALPELEIVEQRDRGLFVEAVAS